METTIIPKGTIFEEKVKRQDRSYQFEPGFIGPREETNKVSLLYDADLVPFVQQASTKNGLRMEVLRNEGEEYIERSDIFLFETGKFMDTVYRGIVPNGKVFLSVAGNENTDWGEFWDQVDQKRYKKIRDEIRKNNPQFFNKLE